MAISAGNSGCTSGLSQAIYDVLSVDTNAGFTSNPLTGSAATIVKALCWDLAQGIAAKVNATGMTVSDGTTTSDVSKIVFDAGGFTVTVAGGVATIVNTGCGGGGSVSSVFGRTGAVVALSGDYTAAQVGADASGAAAAALVSAEAYADAAVAAIPSGAAAGTPSLRALGTTSTTAAAGNDSRLSDARTPTAHASTHASGGTDAVSPASIGALATSALSSATPAALGTAAAGTSSSVSRADHVHQVPTAADVGADASGAAAAAQAAAIAASAQRASNLSDLASAASARTNLGLGGAAVLSVGTTTGTVAAGDDSRITGAAQKSANLSDLASAATARTNLGLGTAATHAATDFDAAGAAAAITLAGLGGVPTMRQVAGNALSADISTATLRTSLGLPSGFTTAAAYLRVNAARTAWEEFVAYSVGHSWQRPDPVTAGGSAVFLSEDDGLEYVSTGTARVAGREGSGWMRRATALGGDAIGLLTTGAAGGAYGSTYNLSAYTIGNATISLLAYVTSGALNGGYGMLGGFGDINGATNGVQFFFHTNGSNVDLVAFAAGIGPIVLKASVWTAASPTVGLHALAATVVNVSGTHKIRFSFDGSAVADVAIGGTYVAPSSTVAGVCLGGRSAGNSMIGAGVDLLLWNADLSTAGTTNATILALATLPGTPTYLLDESAGGANSVVANIRVSAQRYDPNLPAVLYGRGLSSALTVSSVTRTVY